MPEGALRKIIVFGGGRWAGILIGVLRRVLNGETEIVWVSRHCFSAADAWLKQNSVANLQLVRELDLADTAADAVIIATSPENHFGLARQAVVLGLPALCEKPIAPDPDRAQELLELSQSSGCPLGIHLEFLFASYLHDFAEIIRSAQVTSIQIDWQDAWSEERGAELKYGEFYTDLMNDQLPHCWSVLSAIRPMQAGFDIREIQETPAGANVSGRFGPTDVTCRLGRRADQRIRRVRVNDGEWILDFSQEPGTVLHGSATTGNQWKGDRPLSRSLRSFLEVVAHPEQRQHWPLAITHCFDAVRSSLKASAMLRTILDRRIQELQLTSKIDAENPEHVRLLIDRFLPEFAEQGLRFPVRTPDEQKAFAKFWSSRPG